MAAVAFSTGACCFVAGALALADGFSVGVDVTVLAGAFFFDDVFFAAAFATGFAEAALVVETTFGVFAGAFWAGAFFGVGLNGSMTFRVELDFTAGVGWAQSAKAISPCCRPC